MKSDRDEQQPSEATRIRNDQGFDYLDGNETHGDLTSRKSRKPWVLIVALMLITSLAAGLLASRGVLKARVTEAGGESLAVVADSKGGKTDSKGGKMDSKGGKKGSKKKGCDVPETCFSANYSCNTTLRRLVSAPSMVICNPTGCTEDRCCQAQTCQTSGPAPGSQYMCQNTNLMPRSSPAPTTCSFEGCDDATCCELTTCASHLCNTTVRRLKSAASQFICNTTTGCTEDQCCEAYTCASYPCSSPDGSEFFRQDASTTYCSYATGCDNATCCQTCDATCALSLVNANYFAGSTALQTSGVPFGSSSLQGFCDSSAAGTGYDFSGMHCFEKINDGIVGNPSSWIPDYGTTSGSSFVGVLFTEVKILQGFCTARDLGGCFSDRFAGTIEFQYSYQPLNHTASDAAWITVAPSFVRQCAGLICYKFTPGNIAAHSVRLKVTGYPDNLGGVPGFDELQLF